MSGDQLNLDAENAPVNETRKGHLVDKDVSWGGSGRDGDPWVKLSWDVERCYCDQPWRHG